MPKESNDKLILISIRKMILGKRKSFFFGVLFLQLIAKLCKNNNTHKFPEYNYEIDSCLTTDLIWVYYAHNKDFPQDIKLIRMGT